MDPDIELMTMLAMFFGFGAFMLLVIMVCSVALSAYALWYLAQAIVHMIVWAYKDKHETH